MRDAAATADPTNADIARATALLLKANGLEVAILLKFTACARCQAPLPYDKATGIRVNGPEAADPCELVWRLWQHDCYGSVLCDACADDIFGRLWRDAFPNWPQHALAVARTQCLVDYRARRGRDCFARHRAYLIGAGKPIHPRVRDSRFDKQEAPSMAATAPETTETEHGWPDPFERRVPDDKELAELVGRLVAEQLAQTKPQPKYGAERHRKGFHWPTSPPTDEERRAGNLRVIDGVEFIWRPDHRYWFDATPLHKRWGWLGATLGLLRRAALSRAAGVAIRLTWAVLLTALSATALVGGLWGACWLLMRPYYWLMAHPETMVWSDIDWRVRYPGDPNHQWYMDNWAATDAIGGTTMFWFAMIAVITMVALFYKFGPKPKLTRRAQAAKLDGKG